MHLFYTRLHVRRAIFAATVEWSSYSERVESIFPPETVNTRGHLLLLGSQYSCRMGGGEWGHM